MHELKLALKTAANQLTTSSNKPTLHFTRNFYEKAKAAGLTEADARDVYYHGSVSKTKQNMMTKDYNGASLGIFYFLDKRTGQPVISSIWKWEKKR